MKHRPPGTTLAPRILVAVSLAAGFLLPACTRPDPPVERDEKAPHGTALPDSSPEFVNRLWKVGRSSGVEPGTLYAFFGDGTLLITSSHGTPALGRWEYRDRTLTLIEEGIPYPATVRVLQPDSFAITVESPGTPLDITFVRATAP